MASPISLLHGPSTSGSAAAPVIAPAVPAPTAPASNTPRPSRARRSKRPLPATRGTDSAPWRSLDLLMISSPRRNSFRAPTGPETLAAMLRHYRQPVHKAAAAAGG